MKTAEKKLIAKAIKAIEDIEDTGMSDAQNRNFDLARKLAFEADHQANQLVRTISALKHRVKLANPDHHATDNINKLEKLASDVEDVARSVAHSFE